MQRILFLFLVLACGVFAEGGTSPASPGVPAVALSPVPAVDSARPAAPDSLKAAKDSAVQVAAPGLDTLPAGAGPALSPEQLAALKQEMARDKARRDSVRAAREEAASSMEWHTVGDTATAIPSRESASVREAPAIAPEAAASTRAAKPRLPIPEVPQEREPRVLLWAGVGLAATGLLAWLIFTGNGKTPTEEVNLDPVTDPTAGNSDAKTNKTMTIRWSH